MSTYTYTPRTDEQNADMIGNIAALWVADGMRPDEALDLSAGRFLARARARKISDHEDIERVALTILDGAFDDNALRTRAMDATKGR